MVQFHAEDFVSMYDLLVDLQNISRGQNESEKDKYFSEDAGKQLANGLLDHVIKSCKTFELRTAERLSAEMRDHLLSEARMKMGDFERDCAALRKVIRLGLEDCHFEFIPTNKYAFMAQYEGWKPVWRAFESTIYDSVEGSVCYAMGRNTASVFHMMCVLEYGLASLAKALNVNYSRKGWDRAIERIESKVKAELDAKKSPVTKRVATAREKRLSFYSEAAKEFTYFKEAWRNHTAHGRKQYDEFEAARVITHVRDFMGILAKQGLKERPLP